MKTALVEKNNLDARFQKGSEFLDHHPTIYKVALFSIHFCRSWITYSVPMTSVAIALLYRVSVERSCPFRFTFPSLFGGLAIYLSKISPLGTIPLVAYSFAICYIVNSDVDAFLAKKSRTCCEL